MIALVSSPELWAASSAAILSTLTIIGLIVRFVLLPYLRENLFEPLHETRHQVTVNHHSSDKPTLLDLLDDVREQVGNQVAGVKKDVKTLDGKVQGVIETQHRVGEDLKHHLNESSAERLLRTREQLALWAAMEAIAKAQPTELDAPLPVKVVDEEIEDEPGKHRGESSGGPHR